MQVLPRRKVRSEEGQALTQIVKRAMEMARAHKYMAIAADQAGMAMDLLFCHEQACPLKLKELAEASDSDFAHDVFGVYRHFDRETKTLTDGFSPRYKADDINALIARAHKVIIGGNWFALVDEQVFCGAMLADGMPDLEPGQVCERDDRALDDEQRAAWDKAERMLREGQEDAAKC